MRLFTAERVVPVAVSLLSLGALGYWAVVWYRPPAVSPRPLGIERTERAAATTGDPAAGQVVTVAAPASATSPVTATTAVAPGEFTIAPGNWPGFRGPDGTNVVTDGVRLRRDWSQPPRVLWSVPLGNGYAAPAIRNGRVYVIDHDEASRMDVLRCFALSTGQELWRTGYSVTIRRNHGISRTIPAVDDRVVVSLGPKCHLMAADAQTGELLWKKDLVEEYGVTVPEWYAGQCPILENGRVIVATGGEALMVAWDAMTGEEVWRTPNPRGWRKTHSTILPMNIGSTRVFLWAGSGGVAAVDAGTGRLLWDSTEWTVNTATVPTPVYCGEGRVFLSGGYNSGSMMVRVTLTGMQTLFRLDARQFGSDQQTPIFYRGHLFGVRAPGELVCLDLSGREVWTAGRALRFGLGPYTIADGLIFAMDDHGMLTVAEATHEGFNKLGQHRVLNGRESWGPMAFANGRLLVRDTTMMVALDVSEAGL